MTVFITAAFYFASHRFPAVVSLKTANKFTNKLVYLHADIARDGVIFFYAAIRKFERARSGKHVCPA